MTELIQADVKNFKGIPQGTFRFHHRTLVSGKNMVGKTSLRDAIFWVLIDKLSDGSTPTNIKPHTPDGLALHNMSTWVMLTLHMDGAKVTLEKTLSEKWVKHRGESEPSYDGDTVTYKINGNEKSAKDYKAILDQVFPGFALLYGTNAQAFLSLDAKKRRATLLSAFGSVDDKSIALDPKYGSIVPELRFSTEEEAILSHKRRIKELESKISSETAAIGILEDELNEMVIDKDAVNTQIQHKRDELGWLQNRERELRDQINQVAKDRNELADLKTKLLEMKQTSNADNIRKRQDLTTQLFSTQKRLNEVHMQLITAKRNLDQAELDFANASEKKVETQTIKFDDAKTLCPVCGQKLPKRRITEIQTEFTNSINLAIEKLNAVIDGKMAELPDLRKLVEDLETKSDVLEKDLKSIDKELKSIPDESEPDTDEYRNLKARAFDLNRKLSAVVLSDLEDELQVRMTRDHSLYGEIAGLENMLNADEKRADMESKIKMHQGEIDTARADIGTEMETIALLEDYQHDKIRLVTDAINSHFKTIRWEMFKFHKDNTYELCCEPVVNGTSYYRGLNHGDRLLSEIDICQAFQNASGIEMFVTLDDAESVDADRIPILNNQVIVFRRTDERSLTITEI